MSTGIPTNRGTDVVVLNKKDSPEIFHKIEENSFIMQKARKVALPGSGVEFQTITADPTASWVNETDIKPVSNPTLGAKSMKGYTVAVFLPVSKQLVRDKGALVEELVRSLPLALGKKFDETVAGKYNAPGSDFDRFTSCDAVSFAGNVYDGAVEAITKISLAQHQLNGFVFAPQAESRILLAKDNIGRPLFIDNAKAEGGVGSILSRPIIYNKHVYIEGQAPTENAAGVPEQLGIAGDWTQALYGIVESIKVERFDQAAITINNALISLPERNMVAYRAEMEVGFIMKWADAFVRITGETPDEANKANKKPADKKAKAAK